MELIISQKQAHEIAYVVYKNFANYIATQQKEHEENERTQEETNNE